MSLNQRHGGPGPIIEGIMHPAYRYHAILKLCGLMLGLMAGLGPVRGQEPELVDVEGQPLAANVERVGRALEALGAPWPGDVAAALARAGAGRDAAALQRL